MAIAMIRFKSSSSATPVVWMDSTTATAAAADITAPKTAMLANGVMTTGTGSSAPSATQHVIHFVFTDSTTADINVYYDDSFVSNAITATTPTTYNNKEVASASLDNVAWYTKPSGTWETIYDSNTPFYAESEDSYAYLSSFGNIQITEGSVWRVTWGDEVRVHTAVYGEPWPGKGANSWHINSLTDGTNGVYVLYSTPEGSGYWLFIDFDDLTSHTKYVKLERQVTA